MIHIELGPELEASLVSIAEQRHFSVEEHMRKVLRESALRTVQKSTSAVKSADVKKLA